MNTSNFSAAVFLFFLVCVTDSFMLSSSFNGRRISMTPVSLKSESLSMKIFDWKRRGDDPKVKGVGEFTPANLVPAPGSHHRKKRKGRGISAGQGASCGFGMRGQKSRSGRSVRPGFEGGQTPLYRRIPKLVGRPTGPGHQKKEFNLITLESLNSVAEGSTVSYAELFESGALTKTKRRWHKVVGNGELKVKNLTVQAHAFTKSALAAIEENGGRCQLLSPTTNRVLEMEPVEA